MQVKINKPERRDRITRPALVRRSTLVFKTDADHNLTNHLRQVKNLPERVQQDIGECKILCFR